MFSHFHAQLKFGYELTLENVRKTHINKKYLYLRGDTNLDTDHEMMKTLENSYLTKETRAYIAKSFDVWAEPIV